MKERYKSLAIAVLLLLCGLFLVAYTSQAEGWRSPKAEMAGYLFTAIGLVSTAFTAFRALRYVAPVPGSVVRFWGPDGSTKLEGRIARVDGDTFAVDTDRGQFSLKEANFLSVAPPKS